MLPLDDISVDTSYYGHACIIYIVLIGLVKLISHRNDGDRMER